LLFTQNQLLLQGATAADSVEGDRTVQIAACKPEYNFAKYGLRGCTFNTTQPGNYTISHILQDGGASGATYSVNRTLVVLPDCQDSEQACTGLQCSTSGLCFRGAPLSPPVNTPPKLAFSGGRGAAVSVLRGTPYVACAAASAGTLCEAGAVAADAQDGNLTAAVLACPPDDCLWQGCPGHEFIKKGLTDKQLLGSRYTLPTQARHV
jgi:hypothetical protein